MVAKDAIRSGKVFDLIRQKYSTAYPEDTAVFSMRGGRNGQERANLRPEQYRNIFARLGVKVSDLFAEALGREILNERDFAFIRKAEDLSEEQIKDLTQIIHCLQPDNCWWIPFIEAKNSDEIQETPERINALLNNRYTALFRKQFLETRPVIAELFPLHNHRIPTDLIPDLCDELDVALPYLFCVGNEEVQYVSNRHDIDMFFTEYKMLEPVNRLIPEAMVYALAEGRTCR